MSSHHSGIHTNCIASLKWSHIMLFIFVLRFDAYDCRQHRKQGHELTGNRNYEETFRYPENVHAHSGGDHHNRGRKSHNHNRHRRGHKRKNQNCTIYDSNENNENGLSLWISEQQLQMLTEILFPQANPQERFYAIENGQVVNIITDMNMFSYLSIPSEVNYVNFTWKAGKKKYFYNFDRLQTLDDNILKAPTVSIKLKGRIPPEEKNFSVFLPCNGNKSGIAMFSVGLSIEYRRDINCTVPLPGTPLRMDFKKECAHRGVYDSLDASNPAQGPDPDCAKKCINNGFCNKNNICQCNAGYTGEYCQTAICFPNCLNGGNCTAPSVCTCPLGYQGTSCEGGICAEKCENGGKCIQKDKCQCSNGYYGLRCEFSKCVIPCKNGGRCIGPNYCKCPIGLGGNHCEVGQKQKSQCKPPCKHGVCRTRNKSCKCDPGFSGRSCNRRKRERERKPRQNHRQKSSARMFRKNPTKNAFYLT